MLYGKDGGKVYQQNLLRLIISGENGSSDIDGLIVNMICGHGTGPSTDKGSISNPAKIAFQLLMNGYSEEKTTYHCLDDLHGKRNLSRTLHTLSQTIDTELASHLKGCLPLLEEMVKYRFALLQLSFTATDFATFCRF